MGFALFFLFGAIAPAHSLGHRDVLWLPLGDSITFGCTGPTIQDCHDDGGSYRVPLAFALSQPPLGLPNATSRYNVSTMGTLTTGPSYVPAQWLRHEGHPGWQIDRLDGSLKQSLATSAARPDLVTLHIGTNDCNANVPPTRMRDRLDSLLGHLLAMTPNSHVFLADVITTGNAWNACVLAFNALLPNVTATWVGKGMTLTHVPMQGWGCGAGGDLRDMCGGHQIHPTSAGYPRMASSFALKILQEYNPNRDRDANASPSPSANPDPAVVPAPAPAPNPTHYGPPLPNPLPPGHGPPVSCLGDEDPQFIDSFVYNASSGKTYSVLRQWCAPRGANGTDCPTDVPPGGTTGGAKPMPFDSDPGKANCFLSCTRDSDCGGGAVCETKSLGTGACTWIVNGSTTALDV